MLLTDLFLSMLRYETNKRSYLFFNTRLKPTRVKRELFCTDIVGLRKKKIATL